MTNNFYNTAQTFLTSIFKRLENYENELSNLTIDHICYRTKTVQEYEKVKASFNEIGDLLIESSIGGRPIATFKLKEAIYFNNYQIDLIEVPAPKESKPTISGLEHIEFVITEEFNWVRKVFAAEKINEKLDAKPLNSEIEVRFEEFAIKFHHMPLQEVIAIENNQAITNTLKRYNILEKLSPYHPIFSGNIPLGIGIDGSHLDILCQVQDLEKFELDCRQLFSKIEGFEIKRSLHQGLDSKLICFSCEDLQVELFCQNRSVYQQNANLHFLTQARLLKILGENFKSDIIELIKKGLKTEVAFGDLLNLSNPHEDFIGLLGMSERALKERFCPYSSK